jgi:hypothetical protein
VSEKRLCWAQELKINQNQLKKLFLAVDRDGNTAINRVAYTGRIELLEKLWGLCKEMQLNADDLSIFSVTAWHRAAAAEGYLEILERLWLWAEEVQLNTYELQKMLFLEQNEDGESAWRMAAIGGHIEVLEKLWGCAKE